MSQILDLNVTLSPAPVGAPDQVVAVIGLRCDVLGLAYEGDLLLPLLSLEESAELRWYLHEYWQWPFADFAARGERVERELLTSVGRRLYASLCSSVDATRIVENWRLFPLQANGHRQISILSSLPEVLSLPWELLHDEAGFLALRTLDPVSIVRRLPQTTAATLPAPVALPLRVLLVTARPKGGAVVDQRAIARPLFEELAPLIDQGAVEVEMLRPPTLAGLRKRLRHRDRPIHILHFDGHGAFRTRSSGQGEGALEFENHLGGVHRVNASELAQVLQGSGVRLGLLTACESAIGSVDDVFSSVAARLVQSGVDAVVAMSAPVLVVSAAIYVRAFYRALAVGDVVPLAHEMGRQTLHDAPERHFHRRRRDQEGEPVVLQDWWLPHFFAQHPPLLQSLAISSDARGEAESTEVVAPNLVRPRLSGLPPAPFYSFGGRSRELHHLERQLMERKLVVLNGFGGVGKTALSREAAEWLTTSKMFDGACFVSFEDGGNAGKLLDALSIHFGFSKSSSDSPETRTVSPTLRAALSKSSTLIVVDNIETLLPDGSASLDTISLSVLWRTLRELVALNGCGVLLTTQSTDFGDAAMMPTHSVVHMTLQGLHPEDAFALAARLLRDLDIDRSHIPFLDLRDLLLQLDHHPLAIQLVLPTLQDLSISQLRNEFAALLPRFGQGSKYQSSTTPIGATELTPTSNGRHASLSASLQYSLRRLTAEQRLMLSRLTILIFEGGASEVEFLAVTDFAPDEWMLLRPALERAGLLSIEIIHSHVRAPYLRFHPVLIPFLRGEHGAPDNALQERFMQVYFQVADYLQEEDVRNPIPARPLFLQHLPNLRKALQMFLDANRLDQAAEMGVYLNGFLAFVGSEGQRDDLQRQLQVAKDEVLRRARTSGELRSIEWMIERDRGDRAREVGAIDASRRRFEALLVRIEAQPSGAPVGPGSFNHCQALHSLARCDKSQQLFAKGQARLEEELRLIEVLLEQAPEIANYIRQRNVILVDLSEVLAGQGLYREARVALEEALVGFVTNNNVRDQAVAHIQLGQLALKAGDFHEASERTLTGLNIFAELNEPRMVAFAWLQAGSIYQSQRQWDEAERCFREGLAGCEECGHHIGAADACGKLGMLAVEKANAGLGSHLLEEGVRWLNRKNELGRQAQRGII